MDTRKQCRDLVHQQTLPNLTKAAAHILRRVLTTITLLLEACLPRMAGCKCRVVDAYVFSISVTWAASAFHAGVSAIDMVLSFDSCGKNNQGHLPHIGPAKIYQEFHSKPSGERLETEPRDPIPSGLHAQQNQLRLLCSACLYVMCVPLPRSYVEMTWPVKVSSMSWHGSAG